jgi:hypothetical protein
MKKICYICKKYLIEGDCVVACGLCKETRHYACAYIGATHCKRDHEVGNNDATGIYGNDE